MTIDSSQIKMQAPQRLTDNADGGGFMTAVQIVDGQTDNLFDRITRIDRAGGSVSLRQPYIHVDTMDTQSLGGTHVIISKPPADPNVHCILFDTGANPDNRANAANYIENYLTEGPVSDLRLWDTQTAGARQLLTFTDVTSPPPTIGDVICLSVEATGYTPHKQFLRITDISSQIETLSVTSTSTVQWLISHISVNNALDQDYPGANPQDTNYPAVTSLITKVRTTQVSDAAEYYGISNLTGALSPGDNVLQMDSVYGQLVPSTESETGLANQTGVDSRPSYIASGPALNFAVSGTGNQYLTTSILPGSISCTENGSGQVLYFDVQDSSNPDTGSITTARGVYPVDYQTGLIGGEPTGRGESLAGTFVPAARLVEPTQSIIDYVTAATQRFTYTRTLAPLPAPGTVQVEYRALGKWYTLRDNAHNQLIPDIAGTGGGTIVYSTGAVVVSFASEPDVGSAVIWSWGEGQLYTQRTGSQAVTVPKIPFNLNSAINPASLTITWSYDGGTPVLTCTSAGVIMDSSGRTVGYVNAANGQGYFVPQQAYPSPGVVYTISFTQLATHTDTVTPAVDGSGFYEFTTATAPVQAGSVSIYSTFQRYGIYFPLEILDDGNGNLIDSVYKGVLGTINYASGLCTIKPLTAIDYIQSAYSYYPININDPYGNNEGNAGQAYHSTFLPVVIHVAAQTVYASDFDTTGSKSGGKTTISYQLAGAAASPQSQTGVFGPITVNLSPADIDPIVPGSIFFQLCGAPFYDDGRGNLYYNHDINTGSGTLCGTVDYITRIATINNYNFNINGTGFSVLALLTVYQAKGTYQVFFRVPGAPLAVESFHIRATGLDGASLSAEADADGNFNTTNMKGNVNVTTGVVSVVFGNNVTTGGTNTFTPYLIDPGSVTYDAVLISYLPLNPEIIGLDPTRLPLDGRVPIFREGSYVVIHHEQIDTLDSPISAGEVTHLARAPIAKVVVNDENGVLVPGSLYSADLIAGTLTWATPLDLSAYQQPLKATERVEDIRVVTDVQINGQITLSESVSYAYPSSGAYVSSALIFGVLGSRISDLFSQQTWTNVFSETRIGNDSIAKYDATDFPILIDNHGGVTDRWAVIFTDNNGSFEVLSESRGIVATGVITADVSPANPVGGSYFTIPHGGWGSGWVSQNVLRFDTVGAEHNYWIARTVLAGASGPTPDSATIEQRGDSE